MLHEPSTSSLPSASRAGRQVLRAHGFLGLLLALAEASTGCTIVIGERPESDIGQDADVDAANSAEPDRAQDDRDADVTPSVDAQGGDSEVADAETDANTLDAGAHDAGALDADTDAAGDRRDAASDDGGEPTADAAGQDSASADTGSSDSGPDCTTPDIWYPDDDGDGYGRTSQATEACAAPTGRWSRVGGDCYDDNKHVYPGQTAYFGEPYTRTGSSESFDYDCSNTEVGNPGQSSLEAGCGGLLGLLCSEASGYSPRNNWMGPGRNPMCGSLILVHCQMQSLTACVAGSPEQASTPYTCH